MTIPRTIAPVTAMTTRPSFSLVSCSAASPSTVALYAALVVSVMSACVSLTICAPMLMTTVTTTSTMANPTRLLTPNDCPLLFIFFMLFSPVILYCCSWCFLFY